MEHKILLVGKLILFYTFKKVMLTKESLFSDAHFLITVDTKLKYLYYMPLRCLQ